MNRPGFSKLRYLAAAAIGSALIVTGLFVFAPRDRKPAAEPNIDALKVVLEKSARTVLPTPTVATGELVLDVPSDRRDREIDRIVAIATKLGGTALRSESAEGALEVLAQIPVGNAAAFRTEVSGRESVASPRIPPEGETTELILVRFRGDADRHPDATPSGSPVR